MSHSQVLKASAVVMVLFGIALLLVPNAVVTSYKAPAMNGPGIYNTMLYGASLIAFAVINWQASARTSEETPIIILGNLIGNALGLGVAVYRQFADPQISAAAWLNVAIFLVFTVLFAQLFARLRKGHSAMPGSARA